MSAPAPAPANRRAFLRDSFLVAAGAAGGTLLTRFLFSVPELGAAPAKADAAALDACAAAGPSTAAASRDGCDAADPSRAASQATPEQRLRALGITLPPVARPAAVFVPAVRSGNLLFVSGHVPRRADGKTVQGKVGKELTLKQGHAAARLAGVNVLAAVRAALGSLDKVARLVKVLGMVNCTADFTRQPQVVNGFSELMVQVFGETAGKGARSAVGMGSLPGNVAVEIEAIFEVRA